jgi:hypothetical protein
MIFGGFNMELNIQDSLSNKDEFLKRVIKFLIISFYSTFLPFIGVLNISIEEQKIVDEFCDWIKAFQVENIEENMMDKIISLELFLTLYGAFFQRSLNAVEVISMNSEMDNRNIKIYPTWKAFLSAICLMETALADLKLNLRE